MLDTWRTIPELALAADGRSGWSDGLSRAYRQKLWPLEHPVDSGGYLVFVCLETGRLVAARDTSQSARDEDVLRLLSPWPICLPE